MAEPSPEGILQDAPKATRETDAKRRHLCFSAKNLNVSSMRREIGIFYRRGQPNFAFYMGVMCLR